MGVQWTFRQCDDEPSFCLPNSHRLGWSGLKSGLHPGCGLNLKPRYKVGNKNMLEKTTPSALKVLQPVLTQLSQRPQARVFVALSGGLDSVSLLHMVASARQHDNFSAIALHVDHGLQQESARWAAFCENLCKELDLEFRTTRLELSDKSEGTARIARYDWFRTQVRYGDVVLTAHHEQDRAETVLFNLLRGSGSAGLSSLRFSRPFYGAQLLRPLLQLSKAEITEYAQHNGLNWVEDPSNSDTSYARNRIRESLIPELRNFRADAVRNIARAASNLEQENSLLREIAIADLAEVREQPKHVLDRSHALCVDDIRELSPARQANLLRFWLSSLQMHIPSKALTAQLIKAIETPPASTAVLQEEGCQYRFFRGYLYVMPALAENPVFQPVEWLNPDLPIALHQERVQVGATPKLRQFYSSCQQGSLRLESREALINPQAVQGHSVNLKKWLQDAGVPPWRRQSLPILTLRQAQRDVVLAPVDQGIETDWVELRQAVA